MAKGSSSATAILLALSSSTDNFAVGMSVALSGAVLPFRVNAIVAVCNAFGALAAAAAGELLGAAAPALAPAGAAAIFLLLARDEIESYRAGDDVSPLATSAAQGLAWKLAPPMTLNNLAGGVASGVVGISPMPAFVHALLASLVMMQLGFSLGGQLGRFVDECIDARLMAALIFGAVAVAQLYDACRSLLAPASADKSMWEHARAAPPAFVLVLVLVLLGVGVALSTSHAAPGPARDSLLRTASPGAGR